MAFVKIKEAIVESPTLWSPDINKEFILYTLSLDHSIVVVLTQKEEVGDDFLISFMTSGLKGVEINYISIDKQTFATFKSVKYFQPYLLRSNTKVIVPHPIVISFFILKYLRDRIGNFIPSVQEYDLEIKPTKLVKGQGLCKLAIEALDLHND